MEQADARIGGWFTHNLGRKISDQKRRVRFEASDAYVTCSGGTPTVVVPLKRQTGILVVTERPAGVALYNGPWFRRVPPCGTRAGRRPAGPRRSA